MYTVVMVDAAYYRAYMAQPGNRERRKTLMEKRVRAMRAFMNELKSAPCTDCGLSYPPYVMDWDHLRDKSMNLGRVGSANWSRDRILEEVAKCELVCANCHRERTHRRLSE